MLEQIEKIKENTHKVYRSGQLSVFSDNECLQGKVSGRVVSMSDVAPIEHNLWHKETSRNLFDKLWLKTANVLNGVAGSVAFDGDIITYTLTGTSSSKRIQMILPKKWFIEGEQYTISYECSTVTNLSIGTANSLSDTSSFRKLGSFDRINYGTFTAEDLDKDYVNVYLYLPNLVVGDTATVSNIQLELGDTVTDYVPHIIDVDGVKLASKNLFDSNAFVNLTDNSIYYGINENGEIYIKQSDYRDDKEIPACIILNAGIYTISSTNALTTKIKLINVTDKTIIAYNLNNTFTLTKTTEIGIKSWFEANTVLGSVQIEQGTTASPYTPFVEDLTGVEVRKCGANLFPFAESVTIRGRYINGPSNDFLPPQTDVEFLRGKVIRYSAYFDLSGAVEETTIASVKMIYYDANGSIIRQDFGNQLNKADGVTQGYSAVSPRIPQNAVRIDFCITVMFNSNKECDPNSFAIVSQGMVKFNTGAIEYEPYTETIYTANADGTVEGVKSISPNMTLIPNNNAVSVECEYLRDIDLYIDNLITGIALTGGN